MQAQFKKIIELIKGHPWISAGTILGLLALLAITCTATDGSSTDLVNDLTPVHQVTPEQSRLIDRLENLTPTEQDEILRAEWPNLATDIVSWLRQNGRIDNVERIRSLTLFYGSGSARGEDASGTVHRGQFDGELLAEIVIAGRENPLLVAVRCTNGIYDLVGEINTIGRRPLVFTIEPGDSLVDHVDYEQAIWLAEEFELPIQKDRGSQRREISASEALQTDTDQHLVRVLVYAGDRFDLGTMNFSPGTR